MRPVKKKVQVSDQPWVSMPYDVYRADPATAYSDLKRIERSPQDFIAPTPWEPTPAQQMGVILHDAVLEDVHNYVVAPTYYESSNGLKPWNWNATACKEWREQWKDKVVLSEAEMMLVRKARELAISDPWSAPLINGDGVTEGCLFAELFGEKVKGRIDRYDNRTATIVDLKTCGDASLSEFSRDFNRYHYYRQMAFYRMLCRLNGIRVDRVVIIALQKKPVDIAVYEVDKDSLEVGGIEVGLMLDTLKSCRKSNVWPGLNGSDPRVLKTLSVPQWKFDQLQQVEIRGK